MSWEIRIPKLIASKNAPPNTSKTPQANRRRGERRHSRRYCLSRIIEAPNPAKTTSDLQDKETQLKPPALAGECQKDAGECAGRYGQSHWLPLPEAVSSAG